MSMAGYTKLFSTIVTSTIWREPKETKILWITMLALANKDGVVEGSLPGLAHMAGLTVDETESAIRTLLSPDTYSRTKEFEGRRVEVFEGGWRLLNHAKYRAMLSKEERREYLKQKQREYRASKQVSTDVSDTDTPSTHAEADTEAKAKNTLGKPKRSAVASPTSDSDWMAELGRNPAYSTISVPTEFAKMQAWCAANRKEPTRRRFVNWLNRCDKPVAPAAAYRPNPGASDGPKNWRAILVRLYPETTFDGPWNALPESIRQQIKSA